MVWETRGISHKKEFADVKSSVCKENVFNYNKGVLAEILEPIMGKGLIPADLETWKPRRRAIAPAFHQAYLEAMMKMYGNCTERCIDKLNRLLDTTNKPVVDMEKEFLNLGLDIIGLGVFNVDFGSINQESPIIQVCWYLFANDSILSCMVSL